MKTKKKFQYRRVQKGNWLTGFRIQRQRRSAFRAKAGFNVVTSNWKKF